MAHEFFKILHNRKSIRHFSDTPVDNDKVNIILKAAMAAPSARNIQPWLFYVITNREIMDRLAAELPYAKMLSSAPIAFVVAGDTQKGNPSEEQWLNWAMDCAAATQNLLLAIEALELGAVWTAVYPYKSRVEVVNKALSLPEHIIPLNVIPAGYPLRIEEPKDKWDPEKVKWIS